MDAATNRRTSADELHRIHWWVRLIGIVILAPLAIAAIIGTLILVASGLQAVFS